MGSDQVQHKGGNSDQRIEPGVPGGGAAASAGDSILSTISQLESRFDDLRKLHEQTVKRETVLDDRLRSIEQAESSLREREAAISRRQAELDEALVELKSEQDAALRRREELEALASRAEQDRRAIAERTAEVEAASRKFAAVEQELSSKERTLAEGLADLERQLTVGREREQGLAEREHVVSEHDRRVAERERKVGDDEKRLAGAEYKLSEQRQAISRDAETFQAREKALTDREQSISGREQEVEQLKKRFAEQAVRVSEREKQLTMAEESLAQRERAIEARHSELAELEQSISAREQVAADAERKATERQQTLAKLEEQFAQRESAVVELEKASNQHRREIEQQAAAAGAARRDAEKQAKALEELERDISQREKQVESARSALERIEQEAVARQTRQAEENARMRQELTALRAQHDEREKALVTAEQSIKERTAEVRRHAEKLERERVAVAEQAKTLASMSRGDDHGAAIYSGRLEQVQIQLGEATAKRAAIEVELAQARQEIARLSDETRQAMLAANAARESAQSEAANREQTAASLEAELEEAREASRALADRLAQAEANASSAASADELAQRESALAELTKRLEEATSVNTALKQELDRLQSAGDGSPAADGRDGAAAEEIAKRDHAIQLLRERLEQAERHCESLREELDSGQMQGSRPDDAPLGAPPSATPARRERLRRYKSLLQAQARKIVQAQSALQKRHTDCEQLLAQRAKLAAVAADLSKREKKLESGKARVGASAAVLYAVATLGILAVLSWQLARQVWPGTYVATAIIEADSNGRTPNPTELSTWDTFHSELLENPSLIEVAAQRLGQRGITEFSNAAELRSKLKTDMYQQSSEPGQITIELKHQGSERARLILDTFVTALKSVSDASRDQRPDDLGVIIAQAATAGKEPLFSEQLEHAGALLGGGALAAGLFGLVVWNRLARSKQKFEHAQAVEAALNEVDWSAMEQAMKRPMTPGAPAADKPAAERKPRRKA